MNSGLSEELLNSFSDITPTVIPTRIDPLWLAGFTSADGCFSVQVAKSKTKIGYAVGLRFILTQHSRDTELMRSLLSFFNCGILQVDSKKAAVYFVVTKLADIQDKIVPFFVKYSLQGSKMLYFADWCKVVDICKVKAHLTPEGLELIRQIQLGMNRGRH